MSLTPTQHILFKDESNFNTLVSRSGIYVDKTTYLARILTFNSRVILSRPRRFGKSLFLSTAAEYLSGNRTLFKDLEISKSPPPVDDAYNVIHIDMLQLGDVKTVIEFRRALLNSLKKLAEQFNLIIRPEAALRPPSFLAEIVRLLHQRNGKKIVLLIDEYDYPFHRFQASSFPEIQNLSSELADFYTYTKHNTTALAYSIFTGILRLSQLSIYTQTSHIADIDLERNTDAICGYTQEEIQNYYFRQVEELSQALGTSVEDTYLRLKDYYNGYNFNRVSNEKVSVYNPYSIICALNQKKLGFHWAATGIPPLFRFTLEGVLEEELETFYKSKNEPILVFDSFFDPVPLKEVNLLQLLFQTGYLTFCANCSDKTGFFLKFPNQEVISLFYRMVVRGYIKATGFDTDRISELAYRALLKHDFVYFFELFQGLIARIPYQLNEITPTQEVYSEAFYHRYLFFILKMFFNNKTFGEIPGQTGRIDLMVQLPDVIVIIEVKLRKPKEKAETLIAKIAKQAEKGQYIPIVQDEKLPIILLGAIAFSDGKLGNLESIALIDTRIPKKTHLPKAIVHMPYRVPIILTPNPEALAIRVVSKEIAYSIPESSLLEGTPSENSCDEGAKSLSITREKEIAGASSEVEALSIPATWKMIRRMENKGLSKEEICDILQFTPQQWSDFTGDPLPSTA